MKKFFLSSLLIGICFFQHRAQTPPSALRLNSGEVSNTIIFQNRNLRTVSPNTIINFSAMDSLQNGIGNIQLPNSPFSNGFRIEANTPVYNQGKESYLGLNDSLDLDHEKRVVCDKIDIGAYEFQVVPTKITTEPLAKHICEGTPVQLSVVAEGTNVTFQWFCNDEIMLGRTTSTLSLSGDIADTGVYHVVAYGDCCNDTSAEVRVDIDLKPALVAMSDTSVLDPAEVRLHVISSTGTVTWYTHNFAEVVSDLLITDIHHTQYYTAVARNGVCSDSVRADVAIFVDGHQCIVKARPDTTICYGDACLLRADSAFVDYQWLVQGTSDTLPKLSWYRPDSTTRLILLGRNELGDYCSDTFDITVHEVELEVMADFSVCGQPGGTEIQLVSTPQADEWYNQNGSFIGTGNTKLFVESGTKNVFVAKLSDGLCTVEKTVAVTSNPPNLKAFPQDTTICEGERVNLYANVDPATVTWTVKSTGALSATSVNPSVSTIYTATVSDVLCGNVAVDVSVNVQAMPNFEIVQPDGVYENIPFYFSSSPYTSWWTDLEGNRIFPPFTLTAAESFIGWNQTGVCLVSDTAHVEVLKDTFDVVLIHENICVEGEGSAEAVVSGPTGPYTFLWSTGSSEPFISDLASGSYSVTVTSRGGKEVVKACSIAVIPPTSLLVEPESQSVCDSTPIELSTTASGSNISYQWQFNGIDLVSQTAPTLFLSGVVSDSGWYRVIATGDCFSDTSQEVLVDILMSSDLNINYTFSEPKNPDCNDGRITLNITGGNADFEYLWSDGFSAQEASAEVTRTNLSAKFYQITVTDSRGCKTSKSILLPCRFEGVMPNLFITPNGDGKNDYLKIENIKFYPQNRVIIINSYGEEVARLQNYNNTSVIWDGKNKHGHKLPDGVYYYIVEAEGVNPMTGWILMKLSQHK